MDLHINEQDRMSVKPFTNIAGAATEYSAQTVNTGSIDQRGISLDISSKVTDNKAYKAQGRTAEDVMIGAMATDLNAQRNYMVVMSNCVSDEDFARMQKEGFDPGNTEVKDAVTILDHIKTAMIRGGADIKGYTDDISDEALKQITGSESYARDLKAQFSAKDIPLTEENVKEVSEGFERLSELKPISEAGKKYLVENGLAPSVDNLYTASYSAGYDASRQGHGYYSAGEVAGYYAKKPETVDRSSLMPQIEGIIEKAGYSNTEENIDDALWLVEKGVPLTKESFGRLKDINSVNVDMTYGEFADHATDAILDGIPVKKADLSQETSLRKKAVDIYDEVNDRGTIRGRRILEEVRLSMTVEANLKLLRSGFSIDTAPMEELIRNLKEIEKEFAINLTGDKNEIDAIRKKNIYDDTLSAVENIKTAPVNISFRFEISETLSTISRTADGLKADFAKANERYEALMTAPRADMGDSIRKAFSNVDDILKDMDLTLSEENRRAVRILGYNSINIDPENIEAVKEKDRLLTHTISELTPGRVLGMIRDNVNPLSMPISELDKYLSGLDTTKDDMLSYSRFLYKLECEKNITEEERSAYIGIYRLVRQIEKGDFSSIGAINEINAEFNLENMLSTIRSRKHKAMDYKVGDDFGGIVTREHRIESITTQIAKGFITDTADLKELLNEAGSEASEREFEKQEFEEIRKAMSVEEDVVRHLQDMGTPITANNLAGMENMLKDPRSVFERLRKIGYKKEADIDLDSKDKAIESYGIFTGSIKEFLEDEVFGTHEDINALRSMDIKELKRIYDQADFLNGQAKEENYEIPAQIGDSLTAINLKIIHDTETSSNVAISFENELFGKVSCTLRQIDLEFEGICNISSREGTQKISDRVGNLKAMFESEGMKLGNMDILNNPNNDLFEFKVKKSSGRVKEAETVSNDRLYKAAKIFIGFIKDSAD